MFKKTILYINIFFAVLLILSNISRLINPVEIWFPAFLSIAYPFFLFVNIFLLGLWFFFFKNKRNIIVSLLAIVLSWSGFKATINISTPSRRVEDVSIMSWNVKNFDLYNWSKNKETRKRMLNLLEEKKPDVLCLQEFYSETKGDFKNIQEIKKRLGFKYHYFGETFSIKKSKRWGLITFSKYPIINKSKINFKSGSKLNACIYTDIQVKKDSTIRIYNTHLQSIHFGDDDYKYLTELKNEQKANLLGTKKIAIKLKNGFIARSSQAEQVVDHKNNYQGKSIVCGDFNDTPNSYAYQLLSKDMKDAFKEKGIGLGKTLVNPTPFFRIDFVLLDKKIEVNTYNTYKKKYSDHFPIQVYFSL